MSVRNSALKYVLSETGKTATGTGATTVLPITDFNGLVAKLTVANVSGTSPTLDLYLQTSDDGGTTWYDVWRATQITANTTNPHWAAVGSQDSSRAIATVGSKTISANSVGVPLLSNVVRVAYTIGGTTPSFDYTLTLIAPTADRGI